MTKKWRAMGDLYKRFARDFDGADFGPEAEAEMFRFESLGGEEPGHLNGYAIGKKWMDITIAAWREDIAKGLLTRDELASDGYPEWFIRRVL